MAQALKNSPAIQEKWRCELEDPLEEDPLERNGNPLQISFLGNPTDRGAWRSIVHGVAKESETAGLATKQRV